MEAGYRISERLSLRVGDVWQHAGFVEPVAIARKHMKGKHEGRSIPLHSEAKSALATWLMEMNRPGGVSPETYLFASRKGLNRPLRPGQAPPAASLRLVPSHGEIIEPHDEKNVWANRL
jgi:site-specific recombinase XerC